ncbi:unnamed protein product [Dicrocoelium dendriticum]|nr:unnamed protein product [Dicrocoelium dendriticum]
MEIPAVVRMGLLGKFFPFGFCYELKYLVRLAIPIALTTLMTFLCGSISIIACGQIDKRTLATVGLATSAFNVTGLVVITGLLTAADTIFSQFSDSDERGTHVMEIPAVVRMGLLGKFFPFGFCYELKYLVRLAIPIALTTLMTFLCGSISIIACGQLDKRTLATVGLATSAFNVTGLVVITGLLTAADTIFSQLSS